MSQLLCTGRLMSFALTDFCATTPACSPVCPSMPFLNACTAAGKQSAARRAFTKLTLVLVARRRRVGTLPTWAGRHTRRTAFPAGASCAPYARRRFKTFNKLCCTSVSTFPCLHTRRQLDRQLRVPGRSMQKTLLDLRAYALLRRCQWSTKNARLNGLSLNTPATGLKGLCHAPLFCTSQKVRVSGSLR